MGAVLPPSLDDLNYDAYILKSFTSRVLNQQPDYSCPKCRQKPRDTTHLFNGPTYPTSLAPRTLWEVPPPSMAAAFLDLESELEELNDND